MNLIFSNDERQQFIKRFILDWRTASSSLFSVFSDEEVFLHVAEFLANLILCSRADTAVAHFPCDVLPQLTLQLVSYLASQGALNYDFICCYLLEKHNYFLVYVVWFSGPFCLRLVHFCHAGGRDGIS